MDTTIRPFPIALDALYEARQHLTKQFLVRRDQGAPNGDLKVRLENNLLDIQVISDRMCAG